MITNISTTLSQERYFRFLILAPALIIVAFLTIFPIVSVFYTSLHKYSYMQGTKSFIGFNNFIRLANDRFFLVSLKNTFEFAILSTGSELIVGLALALLFKDNFWGRKYILPLVVMPMLLSTMVVCATWKVLFHFDYGLFNYLLGHLGIEPIKWLTNKDIVMKSVVLVEIWQWTPLSFLILLAGLQSIPQELYEAARVDGASRLRLLGHITLPLLRHHILLVILLRSIDTFRIFDKVYALTGGGPGNATETISFYIYREGFNYFHIDRAAAASVVMLLIVAAISAVYIKIIFREQAED
ncbi:ABC transporter permease subunit [candidate division KSB3 bacterium]|uniref:ABC transporter permease subunit n=1 Tax=candidate division KSB3 bacterium TaxID=2044937 RepID=A0A9D5Q6X0_9BACT|nr:ABC transporter permease subunit [candidate division KSB3 bacterium]MBD3325813.1 ABC transporter permease subunit [candidate division KSB3 bacterium]